MEQLVDGGLVLSIGLQDADIADVSAVMEYARITPAVNSLEVHPGNRNDALLAFCRSQVSHPAKGDLLLTQTQSQAPLSRWPWRCLQIWGKPTGCSKWCTMRLLGF